MSSQRTPRPALAIASLLAILLLPGAAFGADRTSANATSSTANAPRLIGDVRTSVDALKSYLAREPAGDSWRKYLHLDEFAAQLGSGGRINSSAVNELRAALRRPAPGLERAAFRRLKESLDRLADGIAPSDRFARPNAELRCSAAAIRRATIEPVHETSAVDKFTVDAHVVGTAVTVGAAYLDLDADNARAALRLCVKASVAASTMSYADKATVQGQTHTDIVCTKPITISDHDIATQPASATASASGSADRIWAQGRQRRQERVQEAVMERLPGSIADSASDVKCKALQKLDERGTKLLTDWRKKFAEVGAEPARHFSLRSDQDNLFVSCLLADPGQLGARTAPPGPAAAPGDVSLRLDETFVERALDAYLSGRTLDGATFRDSLGRSISIEPNPPRPNEEPANWSIVLRATQPLELTFNDNVCRFAFHYERLLADGETYPGMDVTAEYSLAMTAEGLKLSRNQPLQVYPPDYKPNSGQRLGARQQSLRLVVRRVFERLLANSLTIRQIRLAGGATKPVALGIKDCRASDGWLAVELNVESDAAGAPVAK